MKPLNRYTDLLHVLNRQFPLTCRPYETLAHDFHVNENEMIAIIRELKNKGIISRIGLILDHMKIGFPVNALVVWKIKRQHITATGKRFAGYKEVSHCYSRKTCPDWPFNLYTMIHARDKKLCLKLIDRMFSESHAVNYKILWTLKEFKKTRLRLNHL